MDRDKVITTLVGLLPTKTVTDRQWRKFVEHKTPDFTAVALAQGEPIVSGDVIRLYPIKTQAKNPRPLIVTVESLTSQDGGFVLLTDKGRFIYRYYPSVIPTVIPVDGKYKAYWPFRTHAAYLLWNQWEGITYPALAEIDKSFGHAGEHQLPALEQLQNLLGEYIEAIKNS